MIITELTASSQRILCT